MVILAKTTAYSVKQPDGSIKKYLRKESVPEMDKERMREIPYYFDGAYVGTKESKIYFFRGDKYWIYDRKKNNSIGGREGLDLKKDFGLKESDIPANGFDYVLRTERGAYVYFFSGDICVRVRTEYNRVGFGYEVEYRYGREIYNIKEKFKTRNRFNSTSKTPTAAVNRSDEKMYFFYGDKYFRANFFKDVEAERLVKEF